MAWDRVVWRGVTFSSCRNARCLTLKRLMLNVEFSTGDANVDVDVGGRNVAS